MCGQSLIWPCREKNESESHAYKLVYAALRVRTIVLVIHSVRPVDRTLLSFYDFGFKIAITYPNLKVIGARAASELLMILGLSRLP